MLTRNVQGDDTTTAPRGVIIPALATTLGLLFVLAFGISKTAAWTQSSGRPAIEVVKPGEKPSARALAVNEMGRTVGNELLTRYAVPFEVAGLLLTAGLVGAIALAHRDALEEAAPPRGVAARTGGSPNGQGNGEAVLASGPVSSSTPSSGV
jgi:NADH:ubiquinone oxidoreductase subunit 6 (subunit J)